MRLEPRDGLLPDITAAVIQVGVTSLAAILIGNVAKEFAFNLFAGLTL